jgi:phosphatidylglycerophosphate synthase
VAEHSRFRFSVCEKPGTSPGFSFFGVWSGAAMWKEIAEIYRSSKKKRDINRFTEWVARPPAAVVVYALRNTRVTPNQVTFLSALVCAAAAATLALLPGHGWLVAAIALVELSFVLDCADGQLARLRRTASPLGHQLDFLMDEIKAMLLFACVAVRVWRDHGDPRVLVVGLAGLFLLATGIGLTSFTRRPEYGAKAATEDGQPAEVGGRSGAIGAVVNLVEWSARFVVHYPQYIWLCAALDRIDLFFWGYAVVNLLYVARTMLGVLVKLGRFEAPRS